MPVLQAVSLDLYVHRPSVSHQVAYNMLLLFASSVLQWRHQLDLFSNALQTGQLDVRAFGLEFQVSNTCHDVADVDNFCGSNHRAAGFCMHEASTSVTESHVITSMSDSLYSVHGIRNKHVLPPCFYQALKWGHAFHMSLICRAFRLQTF